MPTVTRSNTTIAVTVQGVPQVFSERPFSATVSALFQDDDGADRAVQVCLPRGAVQLGPRTLDLEARAETGASIDLELVDPGAPASGIGSSLADLFAARTRPDTYLTAAIAEGTAMTGAGTVTVNDAAAFASGGGSAYIGGEAFVYGGTTATTLTSVHRAQYDTQPQQHHDGTGMAAIDGSGVWASAAPSWRGREVTVWEIDEDADTRSILAIGVLTGAPQLVDAVTGRWSLGATSLADKYRGRRYGVGLRPTKPLLGEEGYMGDVTTGAPRFQVPDDDLELFATSGNYKTILLAEMEGGYLSTSFLDGTSDTDKVDGGESGPTAYVHPDGLARAHAVATDAATAAEAMGMDPQGFRIKWSSLRHVSVVEGTPYQVALAILLSDLGDLDSGHSTTYDVLPGNRSAGVDEPEWRFGAALRGDQVDVAAFQDVGTAGGFMQAVIGLDDEPQSVGEFLADWCAMVGCYWYVDTSGRITVARLRDRTPPSETTVAVAITDATLAVSSPEALTVDESGIAATVSLRADYDPLGGDFRVTVNNTDRELMRRYPELGGHKVQETRLGAVDVSGLRPPQSDQHWVRFGGEDPEAIRHRLRRDQGVNARPKSIWSGVVTGWDAKAVNPGDIIQATNERLPDLTGGVHNSSSAWLVLGVQLDLDSLTVVLDLRSLAAGHLIAPCFTVSSGGGGTTPTYSNTPGSAAERHSGATPGNHFAVDWDVWCMDDTGANSPVLRYLTAVTGTVLTLDSAPGFTCTHIIPAANPNQTSGTADGTEENAAGYTRADYLIQTGDDGEYTVSAVDYSGTRWS